MLSRSSAAILPRPRPRGYCAAAAQGAFTTRVCYLSFSSRQAVLRPCGDHLLAPGDRHRWGRYPPLPSHSPWGKLTPLPIPAPRPFSPAGTITRRTVPYDCICTYVFPCTCSTQREPHIHGRIGLADELWFAIPVPPDSRDGPDHGPQARGATIRTELICVAGRPTHSGRDTLTWHLPEAWPARCPANL